MTAITSVTPGSTNWIVMLELRRRILRTPLGLDYSDAQLAEERHQLHLAAWHGEAIVGTLLIVPPDAEATAKLRQMAIEPRYERRGLGSALVRHAEHALAGMATATIKLAARQNAVGFYEKLGYAACGGIFIEVTLPHQMMSKRL